MHFTATETHPDLHNPSLSTPTLRKLLRAHLLALPYGALLHVVARVLHGQGAAHIYPTGRHGFVGRNRAGGWDLEADLINTQEKPFQAAHRLQHHTKCLVQVKQFEQLSVQQRTVDELRGCCLRAGAGQGMIVTTSFFSPVAEAAAEASVLAPITLIDGEYLLTLMLRHKLGVQEGRDGLWRIDTEFFHQMTEKQYAAEKIAERAAKHTSKLSAHGKASVQSDPVQNDLPVPPSGPRQPAHTSAEPPPPCVLHLSVTVQASIQTLLPGPEPDWDQNQGKQKWRKR